MRRRKILNRLLVVLVLASLVLSGSAPLLVQGQDPGDEQKIKDYYKKKMDKEKEKKEKRIKFKDHQAAADRAVAGGFTLEAMAAALPGETPHYFSHANYANSALPVITYDVIPTPVGNPLIDRVNATDYPPEVTVVGDLAPVFVVLPTALPAGTLTSFKTWNQATASNSPYPSAGNVFHAYVLRPTGVLPYQYTVVFDSGQLTVPDPQVAGVSEEAIFSVAPGFAVQADDVLAFYGQGIPVDVGGGVDILSYLATANADLVTPEAPAADVIITLGADPGFPILTQDRTYSFGAVVDVTSTTPTLTGGIRKFMDTLPRLNTANNLGQMIPVAVKDTSTYTDADYYEIAVIQYREQMHTDLAGITGQGSLLRGYVQLAGKTPCAGGTVELFNATLDPLQTPVSTGYCGVTEPHYLGAAIAATKDHPVRILFRNLLPTGLEGNLFIPTDVTVMGSGMGPSLGGMIEYAASQIDPMCGQIDVATNLKPEGCFTENRATVHLHGGISPWISDGTPHQWITPVGERPYPDAAAGENKGVSVAYVPDMWFDATTGATITACAGSTTCDVPGATNQPGDGAQTYYFTNQQSARLMFYHDHAWGITRLNVYAGEAAPYIISDDTEASLAAILPAETIPLVLQDKTFVPSPEQIALEDSTWDYSRWGGQGNLWLPHVYSPAQNPGDSSGVNQFGRWAYGPWFWPPTLNILYQPLTNTYFDGTCDPNLGWCEPQMMPGTPFNSMGMEAFHDTPVVNGTAYPTLTVDPKEYRLRFLNAANDRFFNLSFYQAVDANGAVCNGITPVPESTGVACTEVALNPDEVAAALLDPPGVFPTPVAGTEGPSWIQIGTEGGFLPAPVVIPPQPITWVTDPTVFNAGNVDQHSLLLGPAERADAIVDFSQFAGQTLIMYNDAPAAFPARDPRYDYYTGNPDLTDTGGAPSTLPGYGPNTRTVMQIVVTGSPGTPNPAYPGYNATTLSNLETAFKSTTLGGGGVFESGQHPIIVGQAAYNSAYGSNFGAQGQPDGFARITDFWMDFDTLSGVSMIDFPFQPKAIQDEMGEAFDREYGRMSGNLGLEVPLTNAGVLQNLILYPYSNPASELIDATNLPMALDPADPTYKVAPISQANDGTQIWKITHNGVDTHPIHFHLYDVQVLNRVGWDGIIRPPEANELGWKDTVRISPLEDTIVALRPVRPLLPWDLPNSVRLLNPAMPEGSTVAFNSVDENGDPTAPITNRMTNFGWEYVWHCHILSHEEMDMMRPQMVAEPPPAPTDLVGEQVTGKGGGNKLTWLDPSNHETGFEIWRGLSGIPADGTWTKLWTVGPDVTTYTDTSAKPKDIYFYQVFAVNEVGYTGVQGYKTLTATSGGSNIVQLPTPTTPPALPPAAPANLTATVQAGPQVLLNWTDNSNNETGFVIQRAVGGGAMANLVTVGANVTTYTDVTVLAGNNYAYQVAAANAAGLSGWSNTASVAIAVPPAAPTNVVATTVAAKKDATITLTWTDVTAPPADETGYTIQIATDAAFTANVKSASVGANVTTYTFKRMAKVTPYYLRVLAYNDAGQSGWANATPFPIVTPP